MIPADPERSRQETSPGRLFRDDTRFALGRITAFQYITVAVFAFLTLRFWTLQVREHEANLGLAVNNITRTVSMPAPRGKILDRDGRIIVDNHSSFTVQLSQESLRMEHLEPIAQGLGLDLEELKVQVATYAKGPRYRPVPIKSELTPADIAFVEAHRDPEFFPEMEIVEAQKRLYPQFGVAAHVLGYVGEVSENELNQLEYAKYSQRDIVGKSGLERQYNSLLTGVDGQRRVMVDVHGRERKLLDAKEAIPGQNLQLTIDLDLQAVAELAMEGRRGAVVALDPRSGEVLAMVSKPGFDPNLFAGRMKRADWDALQNDPYKPMLNRAIQGTYAPGSPFKPIVALAGLEMGMIEPGETHVCTGGASFYDNYYGCHSKHGVVDLHTAIVQSCDVFFYNVGNKLGVDNLAKYAEMTGVGQKTGIDLPGEEEGLMPSTRWALRTQRRKWYAGETISVAIGQGAVTMTPLQLATSIGGLARGGEWFRPHLVKEAAPADPVRTAAFDPGNIARVVRGMVGVVNEERGTGAGAMIAGVIVAGKTGSAQQVSNKGTKGGNSALARDLADNGWFVGFAPANDPEIVVAVLVETGLHGSSSAPIARDVIKSYFDKKTRTSRMGPLDMALFRRR